MIRIIFYFVYLAIIKVQADIYLHNPRGSNNRLAEANNERNNAQRLFDSENNNRGGYNAGYMYYYSGSKLQIEWTNQHSCHSSNSNCDLIIQYMCSDTLRDGSTTNKIPNVNTQCALSDCNTDGTYGMHENYDYYKRCSRRSRNKGIFTADQSVGPTAMNTRQNPGGTVHGYECSEERDYYPYFQPSPWIDIAVLTNNPDKCEYFRSESENVKSRWYCAVPSDLIQNNAAPLIPINKTECESLVYNGVNGVWTESTSHGVDPPVCKETQFTRDNHLGNTIGLTNPPMFNWTIPNIVQSNCALRIRYNITTNDYGESVNSASNGNPTKVQINQNVGLDITSAQNRGYVLKNNPQVQIFSDMNFKLNLAINTAQYGRVFQDRSHKFSIVKPPTSITNSANIINLNVRGKRGNIVQVYPAVEYDFVPNKLEASLNDYIHYQWTGSNTNQNNNDGQGTPGSDRNNFVVLNQRNFNLKSYSSYDPLDVIGNLGVNYPMVIQNITKNLISQDALSNLAYLSKDSQQGYTATLDSAAPYYDGGAVQIADTGVIHYMCTRNNAFSNRDQKGIIIVVDFDFSYDTIGKNGGNLVFSDGELIVPKNAFNDLTYIRVDVMTLDQIQKNPEFKNTNSNFNSKNVESNFVKLNPLEMTSNAPLTLKILTKDGSSSSSVYRLSPNFLVMTKVPSSFENGYQIIQTQMGGTYVVRSESNIGVIIGAVIGVVVFLAIIMAIVVVLVKNPKYIDSIRKRARYAQRSMFSKV